MLSIKEYEQPLRCIQPLRLLMNNYIHFVQTKLMSIIQNEKNLNRNSKIRMDIF